MKVGATSTNRVWSIGLGGNRSALKLIKVLHLFLYWPFQDDSVVTYYHVFCFFYIYLYVVLDTFVFG